MHLHINVNDWKEEIVVVVPHSWLAFDFNDLIVSDEKWNILSFKTGDSNRLMNSSEWVKGRLYTGPCPLGNQRFRSGGFLRSKLLVSCALKISDKELKNCHNELPSPIVWFNDNPMNTPSTNSVTWKIISAFTVYFISYDTMRYTIKTRRQLATNGSKLITICTISKSHNFNITFAINIFLHLYGFEIVLRFLKTTNKQNSFGLSQTKKDP